MMASTVYFLCALTSAICAGLLIRGWLATRDRLLLWSCLCFGFLMVSNMLLMIDLALLPITPDLSIIRTVAALIGVTLMLFGLIWELRQ